jgi:ATP-binding cassette subfamily C (CFTR/MRP) protein 4
MDEVLPAIFLETLNIFLQTIGMLGILIISNYFMIIPVLIFILALIKIRSFFIGTARDVKRMEAVGQFLEPKLPTHFKFVNFSFVTFGFFSIFWGILIIARSPVFSHLTSTVEGLTTVRALTAESFLTQQFDAHQVSSHHFCFLFFQFSSFNLLKSLYIVARSKMWT